MFQGQDGTAALSKMLKELPQHREQMQKFSLHIDMSKAINTAFSKSVENCTKAEQVRSLPGSLRTVSVQSPYSFRTVSVQSLYSLRTVSAQSPYSLRTVSVQCPCSRFTSWLTLRAPPPPEYCHARGRRWQPRPGLHRRSGQRYCRPQSLVSGGMRCLYALLALCFACSHACALTFELTLPIGSRTSYAVLCCARWPSRARPNMSWTTCLTTATFLWRSGTSPLVCHVASPSSVLLYYS